ncbi:MAG: hypothetical protein GAK35_02758 [Herbaspirillum frisingense]|uniref:Uncharacterized protein n=1 Tax=Herbaspirillum frisingense TaxID=92645 RepID=A0A7V8FVJ0_9BURK|nr:MAG: hypothetical protein GAK35_02758 [Herbaspirillum frisingense]
MSRFYLAPESEAMFRRVTHSRLIYHVHKKCRCGKQTTAKQLAQYGICATCHKKAVAGNVQAIRAQLKSMITGEGPAPKTTPAPAAEEWTPNFIGVSCHADPLNEANNRRYWPVPADFKKARTA